MTNSIYHQPFAVISDIHGNLEALEAVFADIDREEDIERIVCLGDVVGYGPNPVECWRLINKRSEITVKGNHDLALVTRDMPRFHPRAMAAIDWTRSVINKELDGKEITAGLEHLPASYGEGQFRFVHGSPVGVTMDYLLPSDAFDRIRMRREFAAVDVYAFNGHSHVPGVIEIGEGFKPPEALQDNTYLMSGRKAIINVGSVGQPRDGNRLSCYVIVRDNSVIYHRVEYDVEKTVQKIFDTDYLDPFLGRRLLAGK